jgi:hypothetical protein
VPPVVNGEFPAETVLARDGLAEIGNGNKLQAIMCVVKMAYHRGSLGIPVRQLEQVSRDAVVPPVARETNENG